MPKPLSTSVTTGPGQGAGRPGPAGPPGEFSPGGDLSGTEREQEVVGVSGFPLFGTLSEGDVYRFDGARWVPMPTSVATNAERDAIPADSRTEGMLVYSQRTQCSYSLGEDLTTWTLAIPSPSLAAQAEWYVNPASGSDDNDGKTSGTALASSEELARRLCPNGGMCMLTRDVTVHMAAGLYLTLYMSVGSAYENTGDYTSAIRTMTIACDITSSAPITLSGVVLPNAASKVRGQLTTLSGTFVSGSRVRLTSGASVGAIAYSTGLNASAQNTFVTGFILPRHEAFHITTDPSVADTCVVDTLGVVVRRAQLDAGPNARITLKDAQIIRVTVGGTAESTPSGDVGGNVTFSGCEAIGVSSIWQTNAGGANLFGCRWNAGGATALYGFGWLNWGSVVQGRMGVGNGSVSSYGLCIDGGQLVICVEANFRALGNQGASRFTAGRSYNNSGGIEVENGNSSVPFGACIMVMTGGVLMNGNNVFSEMWSGSGSYDIGFLVQSGAFIYQINVGANGTEFRDLYSIASTVNFLVGGLPFAYSNNQIPMPEANCGVLASNYFSQPLVIPDSETDGGFYLKNQNQNLGPTEYVNLAKPGEYEVSGYVCTTTADAAATGTPTLNIIYTDDSGVQQTKAVAASPSLTALGGSGGQVIIELNGTRARWSVTGITGAGSSKYSVRSRVKFKSFGP